MTFRKSSRKILTPVSRKNFDKSRRFHENSGISMTTYALTEKTGDCRLLSSAQTQLASYLAFTCPNSQRRDLGLFEEMERKRKLRQDKEGQQAEDFRSRKSNSIQETKEAFSSPARDLKPSALFPQQHPACGPDWRVCAKSRLTKASITLKKDWSSKTWSNKTNIPERLFLLEADGVDITFLQNASTTSAQVTEAILMRKKEQKEGDLLPIIPILTEVRNTVTATHLPAEPITTKTSPTENQPEHLFEGLEYHPRVSPHLKRKYDTAFALTEILISAGHSHQLRRIEGPVSKKVRVQTPQEAEVETRNQALVLMKKNVARNIFQFSLCSTCRHVDNSAARIVVDFPISQKNDQTMLTTMPAIGLRIDSRGYENIMNEIRFLSKQQDKQSGCGDIYIFDPDYDVLGSKTSAILDRCQRRIHVYTISHCCIIEGDVSSVLGLLWQLQNHDLLHTSQWVFDGLRTVPSSNITWSLSDNTLSLLATIQEHLRSGDNETSRNIHIGWVYGGETYYV